MKPAADITILAEAVAATSRGRADVRSVLADTIELTKPRLNFLVLVTTAVGCAMAAPSRSDWAVMLLALVGTAMCAGGASALNQWWEVDADRLMPRTRRRPLPDGRLPLWHALAVGLGLGVLGFATLLVGVNALTAFLGAVTIAIYVLVYTPMKQVSSLNTLVGAIPGAIPPMMGWTAIRGSVDPGAWALFAILFLWQTPHFLAIATLYRDDYAAGGMKMLPVIDPDLSLTSRQVVLYGLALIPASLAPTAIGISGWLYAAAAVVLGVAFWACGIAMARTRQRSEARRLFVASILYLPLLLAAMMLDRVLL